MKSKQDISGIATLTDNPVAVDNIRASLKHIERECVKIAAVSKSAFPPKK
ncbi:hypothetical protein [uncultured Duncaniella sp.]|nr:hypothetical protein [uncultured Duncaniella sp.]